MKIVIDDEKIIDLLEIEWGYKGIREDIARVIRENGTPLPKDATNGEVLLKMFPPSVYYGDNEKHWAILTKDCELTCLNNEWWNAPYKADKGDKE